MAAFASDRYLLKKQAIAVTGKFRVYDPQGNLLAFSEQKMFKLKEDIRVYAEEAKQTELLVIKARQILDVSAAYDVTDAATGQRVGVLKRKGLKSVLRDEWEVLDANEQPIGIITEDSMMLALLRRFIAGSLVPQNYDMVSDGTRLGDLKQRFNLFRYELDVDFSMDTARRVDRRLVVAAAILLAAIEGKQQS